jgi:mitochondrial import receptor subunit TOM70
MADSAQGLWERISDFASRNRKTILYTVGATTVLIAAGGAYYYYQLQSQQGESSGKKKKKGKKKQREDEESQVHEDERMTTIEDEEGLPQITDDSISALPLEVVRQSYVTYADTERICITIQNCRE